jgi:integrase
MKNRTPSYCCHKATGQAVVRIDGRDHYLGKFGTKESHDAYDRLIAEWLAGGRRLPAAKTGDGLTINELLLAYLRWAEKTYCDADGTPTRELANLKDALRPLRKLYGDTEAAKFGPLAMRTVREDMIAAGLCRRTINTRIGRLKRVFRWGVSYELLPPAIYEALRAVPGLQRGRGEARDTDPVQPVAEEDVRATLAFLPPVLAAVVNLQLLTGCRVSEALTMRGCDLNTTGSVWVYRPAKHKNRNRGIDRVIFLGPQAQAVIRPFLKTDLLAYLFAPGDAITARDARRAASRKTKRTPSELARRRKAKPRWRPRERYDRNSYRQAIVRAADRATQARVLALLKGLAEAGTLVLPEDWTFKTLSHRPSLLTADRTKAIARANDLEAQIERVKVMPWSPLQLRHTAATLLRSKYGVEAAKVILGHARVETSQIYAERDLTRAEKIMAEIG